MRAFELMRTGANQARMIGHNVNVANAVAAIFTATGQDIACVHESAVGLLDVSAAGDGIHARLFLPGLVVGTVGVVGVVPRLPARGAISTVASTEVTLAASSTRRA